MVGVVEEGIEYVANYPELVATGASALGISGRAVYNAFNDVPERFKREAEAYDDDELAGLLYDLRANWRVADYGSEFEGSREDFFMFFDGFFRPKRSQRKRALAQEAEERNIEFLNLRGSEYVVGTEEEINDLPPEKDLRNAVIFDQYQEFGKPRYHSVDDIQRKLNRGTVDETLEEDEVETRVEEIREELETQEN